eukprot:10825129-Lingulodinium_polyedra.AAC.1
MICRFWDGADLAAGFVLGPVGLGRAARGRQRMAIARVGPPSSRSACPWATAFCSASASPVVYPARFVAGARLLKRRP